MRQTVIGILADADRPETLWQVLESGLKDADVTTQESAILALGQLVNREAWSDRVMPILLELAASDRWRQRWRAATTLSIARNDQAKLALAKLRQDENHYVVAAALEAGL